MINIYKKGREFKEEYLFWYEKDRLRRDGEEYLYN